MANLIDSIFIYLKYAQLNNIYLPLKGLLMSKAAQKYNLYNTILY